MVDIRASRHLHSTDATRNLAGHISDQLKEVTGHLTILDKTQPVTIKANKFTCYPNAMLQKRETCGGDFEAVIDRTAFGVNYGVDYGFPKQVRLVMSIEAVKQQ